MKKVLLVSCFVAAILSTSAQDSAAIKELPVKEYPVLFQQQAAEYRALCYQAFNIALLRLHEIPRRKFRKQKLAIITDLDETIIDNSYSEAQLLKEGKTFTGQWWKAWTARSAATAVPGAVEFLQAAKQRGATIFYVSNRDTSEVNSTLINLKKLQLPDTDTAHMRFLVNTSSKEPRRQLIAKDYNVIMLLGDNLSDFTSAFEKKNISDRFLETDKAHNDWGKKFIVLPNPVYGEWESAIYDYEKGLTPSQREQKRQAKLKGY